MITAVPTAINHVNRSDTSVASKLEDKNESMYAASHVEMKQLQRSILVLGKCNYKRLKACMGVKSTMRFF